MSLGIRALFLVYRVVVRREVRAVLEGRMLDASRPEAGRFLRGEVDRFLVDLWARTEVLVREHDMAAYPNFGNRHNVFLAAMTVAGYHALLERGLEREYAMELFADVGWKVYRRLLNIPLLLARLVTRDRQRRMNLVLRWLMWFPFSAPGRPGYEVRWWTDEEGMHTHWTYCAPLGFVKAHVERHGDRGEVEAFNRSWCQYDWPGADLLATDAPGARGHYRRPHTLSSGDAVCDMCWSAKARPELVSIRLGEASAAE